MLVPLQQYYLLLPNSTIAEVLPMPRALSINNEQSDHHLGHCEWRDQKISVIDLEKLLGKKIEEENDAHKLCILNGINTDAGINFYALPCNGVPQLITLDQSALEIITDESSSEYLQYQIKIGTKIALIPNLDKIEETISQLN